MAKCKRCGRRGLFLKTNAEGLCANCADAQFRENLVHTTRAAHQETKPTATEPVISQPKVIPREEKVVSKIPPHVIVNNYYTHTQTPITLRIDELIKQGLQPSDIDKKIAYEFDLTYSEMTQTIRTERSYVYSKSELDRYKHLGIKKVRWSVGKKDSKECAICKIRADKVYWIDSVPTIPAHSGCRCLYAGVIELTGENVPVDGPDTEKEISEMIREKGWESLIARHDSDNNPSDSFEESDYDKLDGLGLRIINIIRESEGILQRDLGKQFDLDIRPSVRNLLYQMAAIEAIHREKEGSSYRLTLINDGEAYTKYIKQPLGSLKHAHKYCDMCDGYRPVYENNICLVCHHAIEAPN